ncbi:chromatin target of PRMT1 protein-like isoform X2 [Homalodisca vitripennis]|uniref:chromatin target of PRMT1 protein-like isoform X2 n=1 Tax=Homalodisca vitripennis TaxID=197043 RepID=UPI001EE9BF67|nr:chromatin target of PRMT1 protein-like isoform X2 [Homalodisca vitripennis]
MSLKKILLKGTTRMSLHERFTCLRNQSGGESSGSQVTVQSVRQGLFSASQAASAKNRRLAQMMDRRPSVIAALKVRKRLMKQRLGQGQQRLSIKDRLSLRGRGGLRGRVGQRGLTLGRSPLTRLRGGRGNRRPGRGNLSRSQSQTNLIRSQSIQSLTARRSLNRGGGDGIIVRGRGRFQNRNIFNHQEFRRGGRGRGFRTRGGGFNRNQNDFQTRRGGGFGRFNNRGVRSRGFRGRGGGRGRGGRAPVPTKEELDSQLDQYMAGSRGVLDRELDSYMAQQESWD